MTDSKHQAKIAFVGCGKHATRALYPCISTIPEIELVATCDLDEDLARRTARTFGSRRWYTDVDELLKAEQDLDGVIIIGWPQMMKDVGEKVMRQRALPIFVEKPPAIDAQQAAALAETAVDCDTWGMVGFMKRFSVGYGLARRAIAEPSFGPISMVDVKSSNGDWGTRWGIQSPGLSYLSGQAVHMFDLIQFLAGPVVEVYAKYLERSATNHGFAATVVFESGAIGTLNLNSFESWDCFDEWLSIAGLYNYVIVEDMLNVNVHSKEGWTTWPADQPLRNLSQAWTLAGQTVPDMREVLGYRGELREFALCILEGRKPESDLHAGAAAMKVGQAVWDSSSCGHAVLL